MRQNNARNASEILIIKRARSLVLGDEYRFASAAVLMCAYEHTRWYFV